MTIQVTGILRNPMGQPIPNTGIRVTAVIGSPTVMPHSVAEYSTDIAGLYNFTLEDGQYVIEAIYTDTYELAGSSIVNAGTPTPVTFHELFQYTTPLDPQQVVDLRAEFQLEIDQLQSAFDTETQEIRTQLVDGDATVLQTAQVFTNDRLGSQLTVLTDAITAGDAAVTTQQQAYTDSAGNVLAAATTQVAADQASTQLSLTATINAQNIENSSIRQAAITSSAQAQSNAQAYSDTALGLSSAQLNTNIAAGDAAIVTSSQTYSDNNTDTLEASMRALITVTGTNGAATAEAYTNAALGYLDGMTGLWVDGPLSQSFRTHTVTTTGGDVGSIEEVMQTFATAGGNVVAKGSMISDVNGKITGYRSTNNGVDTNFQIIADNFAVGHMSTDPTPVFVNDISWNGIDNLLEVRGRMILGDGFVVNNQADIQALDGDTIFLVYQYSIDGISGWHTTLVTGDYFQRVATSTNGTIGAYSAAARIVGDAVGEKHQYSVDGATLWHDIFTTGDVFRRTATVTNGSVGAYGAAARITGVQGIDGNHGNGSFIIVSAIPATDALKDADILATANRAAQEGYIVTYTDNITFATKFIRGASTWAAFTLVVDGDAIIDGTLAAAALVAASITGTEISATANITVGTGNNVAILNGNGTDRISAGNAVMANSPFRVTQTGALFATNATINGEIRTPASASTTSGVLITADGKLYAEDGTFRGTISTDKLDADVVSMVRKSVAAQSYVPAVGTNLTYVLYTGNVGSTVSTGTRTLVFPQISLTTLTIGKINPGTHCALYADYHIGGAWIQYFSYLVTTPSIFEVSPLFGSLIPQHAVDIDTSARSYGFRIRVVAFSGTGLDTLTFALPGQIALPQVFRRGSQIS